MAGAGSGDEQDPRKKLLRDIAKGQGLKKTTPNTPINLNSSTGSSSSLGSRTPSPTDELTAKLKQRRAHIAEEDPSTHNQSQNNDDIFNDDDFMAPQPKSLSKRKSFRRPSTEQKSTLPRTFAPIQATGVGKIWQEAREEQAQNKKRSMQTSTGTISQERKSALESGIAAKYGKKSTSTSQPNKLSNDRLQDAAANIRNVIGKKRNQDVLQDMSNEAKKVVSALAQTVSETIQTAEITIAGTQGIAEELGNTTQPIRLESLVQNAANHAENSAYATRKLDSALQQAIINARNSGVTNEIRPIIQAAQEISSLSQEVTRAAQAELIAAQKTRLAAAHAEMAQKAMARSNAAESEANRLAQLAAQHALQEQAKRAKAAIKIQKMVHGNSPKQTLKQLKAEKKRLDAAKKIQNKYRGVKKAIAAERAARAAQSQIDEDARYALELAEQEGAQAQAEAQAIIHAERQAAIEAERIAAEQATIAAEQARIAEEQAAQALAAQQQAAATQARVKSMKTNMRGNMRFR